MSVSFADEPPSEIQPAQTYRSTGEIHTHQQAWLQLVRTQANMKTHKIKFTFFFSLLLSLFPISLPLHWELVMSEHLITELWLFSTINSLLLFLVNLSLSLSHTLTHTHTHTHTHLHITTYKWEVLICENIIHHESNTPGIWHLRDIHTCTDTHTTSVGKTNLNVSVFIVLPAKVETACSAPSASKGFSIKDTIIYTLIHLQTGILLTHAAHM